MPKRKYKKKKISTPDKGGNSSGSSTTDSSLLKTDKEKYNTKKNENKVLLTNTITEALSCLYDNNNSPTINYDQNTNMNQSVNQGFSQYTPVQSSTPSVSYPGQPLQPLQQYHNSFASPPPPPQCPSPIELILKDLCGKFSIIEQKLGKLDSIEDRLNKFDQKFGTVDSEIKSCKERIHVLEHSAQFLSDIKDEHNSIKIKLEAISQSVEASKNVNNNVKDRLVDVEKQNLSNNLLFFAIEETSGGEVVMDTETNGAQGGTNDKENCVEVIYEFCEKNLKIENPKMKIKIEKAQRLGKTKIGINRPRPIVVKFTQFSDREMVRKVSSRLKGTNYGISPQFPLEILAKRKKLIPVMLEKRKEKKAAFMVGDKLYVDGVLWKE